MADKYRVDPDDLEASTPGFAHSPAARPPPPPRRGPPPTFEPPPFPTTSASNATTTTTPRAAPPPPPPRATATATPPGRPREAFGAPRDDEFDAPPPPNIPDAALRKVRAGGLLTKLPSNAAARPKIRFFRVTTTPNASHPHDELQWGDPKDAAASVLDSKLPLRDVRGVLRGHATKTFERHAKRVGPPKLCFSLECDARTLDLQAGTPADAEAWSRALEALAAHARDVAACEAMREDAASAARDGHVFVSPARRGGDPDGDRDRIQNQNQNQNQNGGGGAVIRPGRPGDANHHRPAPAPVNAPGFSPSPSPGPGVAAIKTRPPLASGATQAAPLTFTPESVVAVGGEIRRRRRRGAPRPRPRRARRRAVVRPRGYRASAGRGVDRPRGALGVGRRPGVRRGVRPHQRRR